MTVFSVLETCLQLSAAYRKAYSSYSNIMLTFSFTVTMVYQSFQKLSEGCKLVHMCGSL